jgi:hypothetical protein
MAKMNPFRFSTIYQDDESDLLMYVHRPYKASTGTWLCKDPLGDAAFFLDQIKKEKTARGRKHLTEQANLPSYLFVCNDPESKIDLLGLNPTYSWGPASNCKQGDKEAFIQVWLGGSRLGGSGVDDGKHGRGSDKPNCPPLYPSSIGGSFSDTPGWSLGVFGIDGGTWGINGEKVEVCHVCLEPCCGGYKIVKIGPCMSYTISSEGGDLSNIGTSSDGPSAGFSQMVNSSYSGVLGGGCIKCANPN